MCFACPCLDLGYAPVCAALALQLESSRQEQDGSMPDSELLGRLKVARKEVAAAAQLMAAERERSAELEAARAAAVAEAQSVSKQLARQQGAAAKLRESKEAAEAAVAQMTQQLQAAQGQSVQAKQQAQDIEAYKKQLAKALDDLEHERRGKEQLKHEVRAVLVVYSCMLPASWPMCCAAQCRKDGLMHSHVLRI